MYTAYFKLSDNPFAITPDPAYLYLSPHHQEAFGHLLYGTGEDGGFVQLTGEVGTGKTTVIRALLRQDLPNVDVALCLNPRLTVEEFLAAICDELKIDYPQNSTLKTLVDGLNAHLLDSHSRGRRTVLIIDEAQNLSREVLEQVRLLTNLETHRHKLLRIILVGQPELQEMLDRRDLRQLAQRITARFHLRPLTRQETGAYVAHRLAVAGGRRELFTPAALWMLHYRAGGIPRLINIICDRALLGAYSQNQSRVTAAIVRRAAREALADGAARWWRRLREHLWLPVGVGIAVGVCMYLWYFRQADDAVPAVAAAPVAATAPAAAAPEPLPPVPEPVLPAAAPPPATDDTLAGAMQRLLPLWRQDPALAADGDPCAAVENLGLRCFEAQGDWNDLRRFNLPALLELKAADGGRRHVLLRQLGPLEATLESAQGSETRALESVAEEWSGRFLVLWQPPAVGDYIGPDSRGEPVRWLRRQLARSIGNPLPAEGVSGEFDQDLGIQVRLFQARNGLETDGRAGPQTLIVLNRYTAAADAPRLVARGGAGAGGR